MLPPANLRSAFPQNGSQIYFSHFNALDKPILSTPQPGTRLLGAFDLFVLM